MWLRVNSNRTRPKPESTILTSLWCSSIRTAVISLLLYGLTGCTCIFFSPASFLKPHTPSQEHLTVFEHFWATSGHLRNSMFWPLPLEFGGFQSKTRPKINPSMLLCLKLNECRQTNKQENLISSSWGAGKQQVVFISGLMKADAADHPYKLKQTAGGCKRGGRTHTSHCVTVILLLSLMTLSSCRLIETALQRKLKILSILEP